MTYNNAVKHILLLPKRSFGTEHVRNICNELGSPHKHIKGIRIIGDAGKTSCANMLTSILSESGYTVGYYSPSQFGDMRESIKIGEKEIPHAEFADIAKTIFDTASATGNAENLSQSDMLFIIALVYFSNNGCDAAIFERRPSDNSAPMLEAPILSVITSIFDSTLPCSPEELIPRGTSETVTCIQHKQIYSDISKTCADAGCRLTLPLYADLEIKKITLFSTRFTYRGSDYSLGAFSPCQLLNAITVIEAAHALVRLGMNISEQNISAGLFNAHLPLMCQVLAIEPTVIVATVADERQVETLVASLAQVSELVHGRIDIFVSPDVADLTADLHSRLASCSLECDQPKVLANGGTHELKAQIAEIICPIVKSEDTNYAALFIGDGKYTSELALQIRNNLGNI